MAIWTVLGSSAFVIVAPFRQDNQAIQKPAFTVGEPGAGDNGRDPRQRDF
jgi:hypothetical protein